MAKILSTPHLLFVNTGTTASPTWKSVQCQISSKLSSSRATADAESKCGSDISLGNAQTTLAVDGYAVKADSAATSRLTLKEWDALYKSGALTEFRQYPKDSITTVAALDDDNIGISFSGYITSLDIDWTNNEYAKFTSNISLVGDYTMTELSAP